MFRLGDESEPVAPIQSGLFVIGLSLLKAGVCPGLWIEFFERSGVAIC